MLERNKPLTKKDTLEFIRAKRDALNEKTVKASPQEEGQYLPEMQMWLAIEARVREMTAAEYGKLHDEICDAHKHCMCASCPLGDHCVSIKAYGDDIRYAVEIVKRWKEEHHE